MLEKVPLRAPVWLDCMKSVARLHHGVVKQKLKGESFAAEARGFDHQHRFKVAKHWRTYNMLAAILR